MATSIETNLDFKQNEALNFVIQNLSSAPSTPVKGQKYYNTSNNKEYYRHFQRRFGTGSVSENVEKQRQIQGAGQIQTMDKHNNIKSLQRLYEKKLKNSRSHNSRRRRNK